MSAELRKIVSSKHTNNNMYVRSDAIHIIDSSGQTHESHKFIDKTKGLWYDKREKKYL